MTETEMRAALQQAEAGGNSDIDAAVSSTLFGPNFNIVLAGFNAEEVHKAALAARKQQVRNWWKDFISKLKDWVQGTVCCEGIPLVDTPKEREALIKKLLEAIKKVTPTWVDIAMKILEKWIVKALEAIFAYLVGLAGKHCDGVACPISPLPVG